MATKKVILSEEINEQSQSKKILNLLIAELPNLLTTRCPKCNGCGVIASEKWKLWWERHDRDWKTAINGNDVPDEDEEIQCNACFGTRTVMTRLGCALANAVLHSQELVAQKKMHEENNANNP